MNVIHKLTINKLGRLVLDVPIHAPKALSCGVSRGEVCVWYEREDMELGYLSLGDTESSALKTQVEILAVMTGESFELPPGFKFLGTVDFDGIIIHIYTKGFARVSDHHF